MRRALLVLTALLLAGCAELPPLPGAERSAPLPEGTLRVRYVDVGQGDGVIWQFSDGTVVVYDCGETSGDFSPMVAQLQALAVVRVHALVVSHGHADHAGGCAAVMEAFDVAHVYDGWYAGDDAPLTYRRFQAAALAEGAQLHTLRDVPDVAEERVAAGSRVDLPARTGASATIVWPSGPLVGHWSDIERESLVVRLAFGETSFCFQGDVGVAQEQDLAKLPGDLRCDAYLVGHHGSRDASAAVWLARMQPEVAVASFGENEYGHPTSDALCRIQRAGAKVYATHRLGTVTLTSDGRTLDAPDGHETTDYCVAGASYWVDGAEVPATLQVAATVSDAAPCQSTEVAVNVTVSDGGAPVPNATVAATWRYKTTTATENATTDAGGNATLARDIGRAAEGHEVRVDVEARAGDRVGRASVGFTPRACP